MSTPTQTQSGKAFEYALAYAFATFQDKPFTDGMAKKIAHAAYLMHSAKDRKSMDKAANEAAVFLCSHDKRFERTVSISFQDDKEGKTGDVRDMVVHLDKGETIGISAKNRHDAVKHSRLSDKIDFGKEWADYPCSSTYMKRVKPVFDDLRQKREEKINFSDIPDKVNRYYLPVLTAFEDELRGLCENYGQRFVTRLFQYLLGTKDFYKIIKENGHVAIISCNINGELIWGKKWKIPDRVESITRKRESSNTIIVTFTGGWQLSFRLHNAKKMTEPSLKFDIRFIGLPQSVARHEIIINQKLFGV